ncbi:MAG: gamma-glutamyl-gamma-aminobutyrate hydrolase family protein [Synergistaceae bacterium]|jgi:putative glutamine amidotransferase|nr:gamma-glutamyl-gamma-aminobutyrate hydrolase family protein [Synergistaceae bacterium]
MNMPARALIGVPAGYRRGGLLDPEGGTYMAGNNWVLLLADYTRAVEFAGGAPVVIPKFDDDASFEAVLSSLSGIVFPGGPDIAAWRFGREVCNGHGAIDQLRDEMELKLMQMAIARDLPIFGICRGAQLINVAFGGTLHQDIKQNTEKFFIAHSLPGPMTRQTIVHTVETVAGTRLRSIAGEKIRVNSFHHQAIDRLGDGLVVSALAPDGCVEAIESKSGRIMGIQWHAEGLCEVEKSSADILRAFVAECGGQGRSCS